MPRRVNLLVSVPDRHRRPVEFRLVITSIHRISHSSHLSLLSAASGEFSIASRTIDPTDTNAVGPNVRPKGDLLA
jgi:hypothetical protein